ncbi:MAG TPA: ATP-binding protein [Dehalococcoidia bacterium]|nr:ATP-binding protein [Dehalococcoidia bacterium]
MRGQASGAAEARTDAALLPPPLSAIARPERLRLLLALQGGPRDTTELARRLGMGSRALSGHLRELARAGLVRYDAGRWRAEPEAIVQALGGLLGASLAPSPAGAPPPPPESCLVCENRSYVFSLLAQLSRSLDEARRQQERLRSLSLQVMRAQEEERKRVARDLHDDTAQALTALLVRLKVLERSLSDEGQRREVEELRTLVSHTLEGVRRLAIDLRPSTLDHLGLPAAIATYAEGFSRLWGLPIQLRLQPLRRRLPAEVELAVYRIVQEALTNVAKHAAAKQASVRLYKRNGCLVVRVSDDGRGFDVAAVTAQRDRGLGIFGMQERAALVGGSLVVRSRPGRGTEVRVAVPLEGPS